MAGFLEAKYDDAVDAILHLISRNAEITSERERARQTAVLLEQALTEAEGDLSLALKDLEKFEQSRNEIENWKRLYDLVESEKGELADRVKELERANSDVETVADLTLDHLDALVTVHIDGQFSITDRLVSLEFVKRHDLTTARVTFETAGTGPGKYGYAVDLHQPATVLEPAREMLPF